MQNAIELIGYHRLREVVLRIQRWWLPFFQPQHEFLQLTDEPWAEDVRTLVGNESLFRETFVIDSDQLRFSNAISAEEKVKILELALIEARKRMTVVRDLSKSERKD